MAAMNRLIECVAFPLIVCGSLAAFQSLLGLGVGAWPAAYTAVGLGFLFILLHETYLPERTDWRPNSTELSTDLLHLVLIQILLPRMLSLGLVLALAEHVVKGSTSSLWPHGWSPWAQLLLLLLLAEFPRYWLHRLSHNVNWLWRFHAVHHSPRLLYSVNVGRFHPVDKALQYVVEVLPFVALGVSPAVLALYFVFYAVTGFYQHANCRVRIGPLNWLIAGPELHRWHHSLNVEEARSNYGNKLIIWDVLFGTRFLPRNRGVSELGIADAGYPVGFLGQMAAPFLRGGAGRD